MTPYEFVFDSVGGFRLIRLDSGSGAGMTEPQYIRYARGLMLVKGIDTTWLIGVGGVQNGVCLRSGWSYRFCCRIVLISVRSASLLVNTRPCMPRVVAASACRCWSSMYIISAGVHRAYCAASKK